MMNENSPNPYAVSMAGTPAIYAEDAERLGFIRRTYTHLTGAVVALIGIEAVLFKVVPAETMQGLVQKLAGGFGWLLVLGAFMVVSWIARSWATRGGSRAMQYAGLSLYVGAWAVMLLPMLYICIEFIDPKLPVMAAAITGVCFVGLTVFVFTTRVDLAGWGKFLALGGIVALALIVAGICFGVSMGLWFSSAMVALACGYILYDTSNVLHHYNTSQHVAASLALFASVVLLFWYVLRVLMMFANND